ncbi:MAG: L,D-transpeptidase family protein [Candidatus Dormibacteria bacterium]
MRRLTNPKSQLTAPRRRRLFGVAVVVTLIAVLLTSAGVGAQSYGRQQSALSGAQAERAAARHTLEAALGHARGSGVPADRLATIVASEHTVLAEASLPSHLGLFDAGEIGHVRDQASRLRTLIGQVDAAQVQATAVAADAANRSLDGLAAAIADEQSAGLDAAADLSSLHAARLAVSAATSPDAVAAAVLGIDDRAGAAHQAADQKRAADAAAAAARVQAKLDASRADAQAALGRADRLLGEAHVYPQLQVGAAAGAIAAEHAAFSSAKVAADFDAVTGATGDAADSVAALLSSRSGAYAAMATARNGVGQAQAAKVDPGTVPAQLDALQAQLDAAGTRPALDALTAQVAAIVQPLLDRLGLAQVGAGKVIVINLANQSLTAYQDGAPFLTTPVTTGRPALPTPPGTYSVVRKNHPWTMVSDWPRDSPYWYPPSPIQYVLWFTNTGYGIHDAPWRSYYGPGTQAHGSHGCVNVPMPTMTSLFSWADVGTRVVVH